MDNKNSNSASQAPKIEDLINLCRELNQRKANYIVVGGMAVLHHGFLRATEDIDLLVETTPRNEKAVIESVSQLPDGAAKELKPGDIEKYEVIRVADSIVVDLMARACGVTYKDSEKSIIHVTLDGVDIPFASLELMIRLKQGIRPKDQMDLAYLKAVASKT